MCFNVSITKGQQALLGGLMLLFPLLTLISVVSLLAMKLGGAA